MATTEVVVAAARTRNATTAQEFAMNIIEQADSGSGARARKDARPVRDDPVVIDLVTRARAGDRQAWDALVERYAPLIWCICRRHRLGGADAEDVGQSVWVQVLDHLDKIRDPAALPGWLATATRRECLRVLRAAPGPISAVQMLDAENIPDEQAETVEQELLVAERHVALREAFSHLPPDCQRLMTMLIADPPASYAEISTRLGIPVGSIGPKRGRCLDKLRADPAIAALINAEAETARHEIRSPALVRWSSSAELPLSGLRNESRKLDRVLKSLNDSTSHDISSGLFVWVSIACVSFTITCCAAEFLAA